MSGQGSDSTVKVHFLTYTNGYWYKINCGTLEPEDEGTKNPNRITCKSCIENFKSNTKARLNEINRDLASYKKITAEWEAEKVRLESLLSGAATEEAVSTTGPKA